MVVPIKNSPAVDAWLRSEKLTKYDYFLITLLVATIASVAVFVIFYECEKTYLAVPEFEVEMASVSPLQFAPVSSPLNVTVGYNITGDWKPDFGVRNPNKNYALTYADMNVTVEYSWLGLRWDGYKILGFHDQDSVVHATPSENPRFPFIEDGDRVGIFSKWISKYGSRSPKLVDFKVKLRGVVMQKAAGGKEEEKWRKVDCDLKDVGSEITAAGVTVVAATPSDCETSVHWRWSWVGLVAMFVLFSLSVCYILFLNCVNCW